jgi:hypothetical protein
MKNCCLLFLLIILFTVVNSCNQNSMDRTQYREENHQLDTTEKKYNNEFTKKMLEVQGEVMKGKKVYEVLQSIGRKYDSFFYVQEPPGRLNAAVFVYNVDQKESINLKVFVVEFQYLEQVVDNFDWDINLFKKERVKSVLVTHIDSENKETILR